MSPAMAWTVVIVFYLAPLAHVLVSSRAGPWRAPEGATCPFSPRVGWLVIVLMLGPFGWLLFWNRLRRSAQHPPSAPPPSS